MNVSRIRRCAQWAWFSTLLSTSILFLAIAASYGWIYAHESGQSRLVCLMYHRFVTDEEYRNLHGTERLYSIPVSRFEEQLAHLRAGGYHAVTMDDALAFVRGERELPQPAAVITIDDGCRSAAT